MRLLLPLAGGAAARTGALLRLPSATHHRSDPTLLLLFRRLPLPVQRQNHHLHRCWLGSRRTARARPSRTRRLRLRREANPPCRERRLVAVLASFEVLCQLRFARKLERADVAISAFRASCLQAYGRNVLATLQVLTHQFLRRDADVACLARSGRSASVASTAASVLRRLPRDAPAAISARLDSSCPFTSSSSSSASSLISSLSPSSASRAAMRLVSAGVEFDLVSAKAMGKMMVC